MEKTREEALDKVVPALGELFSLELGKLAPPAREAARPGFFKRLTSLT